MTSTALTVIQPPVTILEPMPKPDRRGGLILTDRICQKRVTKRTKIYDRKASGLYVSIIPAGVATFAFKFTNPATGKQRSTTLGTNNPETFTVEDARSKVYALKAMDPAALATSLTTKKTLAAKRGRTVDDIIGERVAWMKTKVRKPDGEMRPRIESWETVASHLRRFLSPRLGHRGHQAGHR
ncbi:hypothetical protein ACFQZO_10370 [Bradyrhizobium sp. GCM10027634]|uniref:hypothetical protein n=1 Tax=unclassified Bradyrhizobium TaxID=2631580 RepID=UPI00263A5725|nr:hypothetical protein [Bradyrhizobium sp. WYCCWR 12677]MDN5001287.1 hypothetical protein [Bradyrhizobium sp. WYCCWR 12677]